MQKIDPQIEPSWKNVLSEEFDKEYFIQLKEFLAEEKKQFAIYPPGNLIFSAFNFTPFDQVKVVIVGQDPYHGTGQAHGLCFSVAHGITKPPSLVNIFKEIQTDLGFAQTSHGCLESWAKQGVFLLNAILTVRANTASSHQGKGWEKFTDSVIRTLSDKRQGLVFLLWGNYAKSKENLIDTSKHFVLKAAHPSPFSAYNGFFGCRHFSKTNEILMNQKIGPIDWRIE